MPYINKPKKETDYHLEYTRKRDRNDLKLYQTSTWRKLRESYLMDHPLCQDCELEGASVLATEVHHVRPILTGSTEAEKEALAFDYNNLRALCTYHHHLVHNETRAKKKREA